MDKIADKPRLELVHLSPTADSALRWADGSLKGMKTLKWLRRPLALDGGRDCHMIPCSPMHHAEWLDGKLSAANFYNEQQLRGEGGIHAIWPPRLRLDAEDAGLDEFVGYAPRRKDEFTCLVSGWGRVVMGDVGWRAEHCRIRTVISAPRTNARALKQWCLEHEIGWSVL